MSNASTLNSRQLLYMPLFSLFLLLSVLFFYSFIFFYTFLSLQMHFGKSARMHWPGNGRHLSWQNDQRQQKIQKRYEQHMSTGRRKALPYDGLRSIDAFWFGICWYIPLSYFLWFLLSIIWYLLLLRGFSVDVLKCINMISYSSNWNSASIQAFTAMCQQPLMCRWQFYMRLIGSLHTFTHIYVI